MSSSIPTEDDIVSVMPKNEWLTVEEIAERLLEFPSGFVAIKLKKMLRSHFYKIKKQGEGESLQYMRYFNQEEFDQSVVKLKHIFTVARERKEAREVIGGV